MINENAHVIRDADPEFRKLDYFPVELPQPRNRLSRIVRAVAHMRGLVSRGEHDEICEQLFAFFDGKPIHHQDLITRAALAYEGLTGIMPLVGALKCDRSDVAILAIAVAFRGGGGFCACRAITLTDPSRAGQKGADGE